MKNINDYKLVVICGTKDEDGLIRYFGESNEYKFHIDCLKDYMYTYHSDLAESINADALKDNNELIIYLNNIGDIIYLHSFGYGLLFVPERISEKQFISLYALFSSFEKMPIYINYNLYREDNKIKLEENFSYVKGLENTEILDKFFENKSYVKRKVK